MADINNTHGKATATGTLMATLDDRQLEKVREARLQTLLVRLNQVPSPSSVVGVAYTIANQARGGRWFFSHQLYQQFRATLVRSAVMDGMEAEAQAKATGRPIPAGAGDAKQIVALLKGLEKAEGVVSDTAADNQNERREAPRGWSNSVMMKPGAKGWRPAQSANHLRNPLPRGGIK